MSTFQTLEIRCFNFRRRCYSFYGRPGVYNIHIRFVTFSSFDSGFWGSCWKSSKKIEKTNKTLERTASFWVTTRLFNQGSFTLCLARNTVCAWNPNAFALTIQSFVPSSYCSRMTSAYVSGYHFRFLAIAASGRLGYSILRSSSSRALR